MECASLEFLLNFGLVLFDVLFSLQVATGFVSRLLEMKENYSVNMIIYQAFQKACQIDTRRARKDISNATLGCHNARERRILRSMT